MASITPVAYKTGGGSIAGTTKYGNLYVGTSQLDYGVVGQDNGVVLIFGHHILQKHRSMNYKPLLNISETTCLISGILVSMLIS